MYKLGIIVIAAIASGVGFYFGQLQVPPVGAGLVKGSGTQTDTVFAPTAPAENTSQPHELNKILAQRSWFDTQYTAYQVAATAEADQLLNFADTLLRRAQPRFQQAGIVFLQRLGERDIARALAMVENLPPSPMRTEQLSNLIVRWMRRDAEAALTYYTRSGDIPAKMMAARKLLRRSDLLSETEQAALYAGLPAQQQNTLRVRLGVEQIPTPDDFSDRWAGISSETEFAQLLSEALRTVHRHPDETMAMALALPDSPRKVRLLNDLLMALAGTDPVAALDYYRQSGLERNDIEQHLLMRWIAVDPAGARAAVEAYVGRSGNRQLLSSLPSALFETDPRAALQYFNGLTPEQQRQAVPQLAYQYLQYDPDQAFRWLMSQELPRGGLQNYMHVASQYPSAARTAEELLATTSDAEQRQLLVGTVALSRAQSDPAGALQWLDGYAGEMDVSAARTQAMNHWLQQDWTAASDELSRHATEPAYTNSFRVAAGASQRGLGETTQWALDLPPSPGRNAAIASVIPHLARSDTGRARELLDELPQGPERTRAGLGLATMLARGNPEQLQEVLQELDIRTPGFQFADPSLGGLGVVPGGGVIFEGQ